MDEKNVKTIDHPLDDVFGVEKGLTEPPEKTSKELSIIEHDEYDNKDKEIEEQLEQVRLAAMDAFEDQQDVVEIVEGKYVARNQEVAVQMLNTALAAIKEKAVLKQNKDKLIQKNSMSDPKTVNNNIVLTNSDLLKMLQERDKEKNVTPPIEGEKE